jgi:YD repeat-containing protein
MSFKIRHGLLVSIAVIGLFFISVFTSYTEATNYVYDELNRLIRVEYEDGTVIEYTYDKAGNRLEKAISYSDTTPPATTASPPGGTLQYCQVCNPYLAMTISKSEFGTSSRNRHLMIFWI